MTPNRRLRNTVMGLSVAIAVIGTGAFAVTQALAAAPTPTPTMSSGPTNPTTSQAASFSYTDSKPGASFRCALDSGTFKFCSTSGKTYSSLSLGSHTFRVEARAFSFAESAAASWTWTIVDPNGPPAPVITERPNQTTDDTGTEFEFFDRQGDVGFLCSLDGGSTQRCTGNTDHDGDHFSQGNCRDNDNAQGDHDHGGRRGCSFGEIDYSHLSPGQHCFQVVAVDRAGQISDPAEFCWTIKSKNRNRPFTLSGNASSLFFPGAPPQQLNLLITNPNNYDLKVTGITVSVQPGTTTAGGNPNPACNGSTNLTVTRQFSGTVVVPASSTDSLLALGATAGQYPLLQMPDLPVNQDACENTTFHLSYTGTGVHA